MSENELPDWTTELDEEILNLLNTELILTPTVIAENIDRSRGAVARRLNTLEAGGLVKKLDRGKYQITVEGLEVLPGGYKISTPVEEVNDTIVKDIWEENQFRKKTGMTREEYFDAVSEEREKLIQSGEGGDLWEKAFEIVDDQIKKDE
jgi:DNA-binding Lrp family transcriptional regulator